MTRQITVTLEDQGGDTYELRVVEGNRVLLLQRGDREVLTEGEMPREKLAELAGGIVTIALRRGKL